MVVLMSPEVLDGRGQGQEPGGDLGVDPGEGAPVVSFEGELDL